MLALVISGFSVFWHYNALSIACTLCSFWFLSSKMVNPKVDPGVGSILGFVNLIVSPIGAFVRLFQRMQGENTGFRRVLNHLLIPGFLVFIFGILYYHSSPTFRTVLEQFNWDDLPSFVFTIIIGLFFGTVLLYSFLSNLWSSDFAQKSESLTRSMGGESYLTSWKIGIWSIVVLLSIVVVTDFYYKSMGMMPEGLTYSSYLHQGVFSLIVSIVLAAIIAVLTANYTANQPSTGMLAANYSFLGLNFVYVWQNVFRNQAYVLEHGLTEKRIIIFFYLVVCLFGLLITAYTIYKNMPIGFLYKWCSYCVFLIAVTSSLFDWSSIITQHNVNHPDFANKIDHEYLLSLNKSNTHILYEHMNRFDESVQNQIHYRAESITKYSNTDLREMRLGHEITANKLFELMKTDNN